MSAPTRPLRVGNLSASRGDRVTALAEVLAGGAVDVIAVDMLSDEAMVQLADERAAGGDGTESALLDQLDGCRDLLGSGGTRVVTNAGGLDPSGLAARVRDAAARAGRELAVAWVDPGELSADDVPGLAGAEIVTARHGALGIAAALEAGADVVVTGRVSREALVLGAAVAHHGWTPAHLDALAGAVAAGHVLSGGPGATGVSTSSTDVTRSAGPVAGGYPVAEIAADGGCVVTKHPSALGSVTVGTVTDQLLDGVSGARYPAPDVVLRLDSLRVVQEGTDRVRVSGARGEAPPETLDAVGLWHDGGRVRRDTAPVLRTVAPQHVVLASGERRTVAPPPARSGAGDPVVPRRDGTAPGGRTRQAPLASVAGVRAGIVGAGLNLAVWTWDDTAYAWLRDALDTDVVAGLLPDLADRGLSRHELPNLRALNFVVDPPVPATEAGDPGRRLWASVLEIPTVLLEVDP